MSKGQRITSGALTVLAAVALLGSGDLALAQQSSDQMPDQMIKMIVEHRLAKKRLQRQNNIAVSVDDSIVTLKGSVRSIAEKRRAEKESRGVDDVMRVINELAVETNNRSDQEVARDVVRSIRSFAFFDIFDWVEGEVRGGSVTLRGAVREPWRKDDYGRLAEDVAGVKEVKNEIRELPLSPYDDQLRIAVSRLIYGDPRFVRFANRSLPPIHILVENGRIWLKGAVATPLEKQLAETLVRSSVLSFEVTNDLLVDSTMEEKKPK